MAKGMQDILKQAQKMQEKMQEIQEGLGNITVEGSAGSIVDMTYSEQLIGVNSKVKARL